MELIWAITAKSAEQTEDGMWNVEKLFTSLIIPPSEFPIAQHPFTILMHFRVDPTDAGRRIKIQMSATAPNGETVFNEPSLRTLSTHGDSPFFVGSLACDAKMDIVEKGNYSINIFIDGEKAGCVEFYVFEGI